jgi:hypothetical protein
MRKNFKDEYVTFADLGDALQGVNVVEFAHQIVNMDITLRRQEAKIAELEQYRKDYFELLNSSMQHSDAMMHNLLKVVLTDGVSKKFIQNGKAEDFKS